MGRESCPDVPCVTSGARARSSGGRADGVAEPLAAVDVAPGHSTLRSRSLDHLGASAHHRRAPAARGWPRGTTPVCRSRRTASATASTSMRPSDSHRRQTRSYTLHGSAGSSATAALGISAPHRRVRARGRRAASAASAAAEPATRKRIRSPSQPSSSPSDASLTASLFTSSTARPPIQGRSRPRAPPVPSSSGSRDTCTLPSRWASSASARWCVLTATARRGGEAHRGQPSRARSTSGGRPTGHRALGRSRVSGRRRVPRPAANTMPARLSAMTEARRFFNPSQPQTLQISVWLLYFNAFWALLSRSAASRLVPRVAAAGSATGSRTRRTGATCSA